jgi:hypothetical protein
VFFSFLFASERTTAAFKHIAPERRHERATAAISRPVASVVRRERFARGVETRFTSILGGARPAFQAYGPP